MAKVKVHPSDPKAQLCSTREAAEILGVSLRTIQVWVDRGVLVAWKTAGGHRRVSLESVMQVKQGHYPEALPRQQIENSLDVLLAYQPIVNGGELPFGYELLYREGDDRHARIKDPVEATSKVIAGAFGQLGLLGAMGEGICFINVEEQMLFEDVLLTLLPERIVLEIPATTAPTKELTQRCRFLREKGYRLLLENFTPEDCRHPLLAEAKFVKVDSRQDDAMRACAALLPSHIEIIAGRVETEEAFQAAFKSGARYFQGFYFANLNVVRGAKVAPQQAVILDVLAMTITDAELVEIEKKLKTEPLICFSLLRLVNSAGISSGRRIETLREAIMILGRKNLQRWLQVLLFAYQSHVQQGPTPLLLSASFRGRFLEYLAVLIHDTIALPEKAFMVGILSYVEALLRIPLVEVLGNLHLSREVELALLKHDGMLGMLLKLVEALDHGNFKEVQITAQQLGISHEHLQVGLVESLRFSNAISHA